MATDAEVQQLLNDLWNLALEKAMSKQLRQDAPSSDAMVYWWPWSEAWQSPRILTLEESRAYEWVKGEADRLGVALDFQEFESLPRPRTVGSVRRYLERKKSR